MMKKIFWIFLGSFISICVIFLFEYASFSACAMNRKLFYSVIEEHALEEKLGIPKQDLRQVSDSMLDYVRQWKEDDSLQVVVTKKGTRQNFYTESEIGHIEDVRKLVCNIRIVLICMAGLLILLIPLFIREKKYRELCQGYFFGIGLLLVIIAVVTVIAVSDINQFIYGFHNLFFDNKNWIMNPAREKIVYFFPDSLYEEVLKRMLICNVCFFTVVTGGVVGYLRKGKRTAQKTTKR